LPNNNIVIHQLKPKVYITNTKPSHALGQRAPFPQQNIYQIVQNRNIPGLLPELIKYMFKQENPTVTTRQLNSLSLRTALSPEWQTISVWTRVSIALPVASVELYGKVERSVILACPETPKSKIPCFDVVFIDKDPDSFEPQDGIKSECIHFILS